MNKTLIKFEDG